MNELAVGNENSLVAVEANRRGDVSTESRTDEIRVIAVGTRLRQATLCVYIVQIALKQCQQFA